MYEWMRGLVGWGRGGVGNGEVCVPTDHSAQSPQSLDSKRLLHVRRYSPTHKPSNISLVSTSLLTWARDRSKLLA